MSELAPIHVTAVCEGPRVVLVHGAMTTSRRTWERQLPLSERWTLVIPDRRGFAPNPASDHSDYERDAIAAITRDIVAKPQTIRTAQAANLSCWNW